MHTKEPWSVRELIRNGAVVDCFVEGPREEGMAYCAEILGDDYSGFGDLERKRKDAARIVACVNGCAGINPAAARRLVEAAEAYISEKMETVYDASTTQAARVAIAFNTLAAAVADVKKT